VVIAPSPLPGGASLAVSTEAGASVTPKPETKASTEKRGGSGSTEKRGGSGSGSLPPLPAIQWEKRTDRPGYACWHAPEGAQAHRNTKTYLGYVGKQLLAEWLALSESERLAIITAWVVDRRREKGIG
jgi:hypothetical protein